MAMYNRLHKNNLLILSISIVFFIIILVYCIKYDPFVSNIQHIIVLKYINYYLYLGIDGISICFLLLTTFIMPLCILFIWNTNFLYKLEYNMCLISIEVLIIFVFLTLDILFFYIFFEAILIPFFILIGLYGSRVRKIHASYMLFFYTVLGSISMLIAILYLYIYSGTTNYILLWSIDWTDDSSAYFIWWAFFLSFSTKIPVFPFHIWLPEAHVESPTEASVILAAILLKIGVYGFFRILLPIFTNITIYYSDIIQLLNVCSIIYASLITLRQIDIKKVIAYSSIGHMNVCVLGVTSFDPIILSATIVLMIGHGLISGGLFFIIGMLYDRYKTKLIFYYSGLIFTMPTLSFFFFLFILSNISLPLSFNFVGELLILYKLISEHQYQLVFYVSCSIFLCAAYSIWLFNRVCFGLPNLHIALHFYDLKKSEFTILMLLTFFIWIIGVYWGWFINIYSSNMYYYFCFFCFK